MTHVANRRRFGWLLLAATLSCGPPDAANRALVNGDEHLDGPLAAGGSPAIADASLGGGGSAGAAITPDAAVMPQVDLAPITPPPPQPDAAVAAADKPPLSPPPPDSAQPLTEPLLMVTQVPGVDSTNLTTTGTLDWAHWGYLKSTAVTRKKDVATALIGMTPTGTTSLSRYTDRPVHFSWSDGTPTASVSDTPDGVDNEKGANAGFQITAQGNPARPRTLKLFIGAWQAVAKLTAKIGTKTFSDVALNAKDPGADRIYTIVFQPAAAGQKLTVDWIVQSTNATYGNVTLQAAALTE